MLSPRENRIQEMLAGDIWPAHTRAWHEQNEIRGNYDMHHDALVRAWVARRPHTEINFGQRRTALVVFCHYWHLLPEVTKAQQ